MNPRMEPTRKEFGQALAWHGDDKRIVCLGLDVSGSITISDFYAGKPERNERWLSIGIAEQSATAAAAGLAKEGKLPVFGTDATFAAARNLDQIRTSIYGNFNVLIAGAEGCLGRARRRDPSSETNRLSFWRIGVPDGT
jgi:transketolase